MHDSGSAPTDSPTDSTADPTADPVATRARLSATLARLSGLPPAPLPPLELLTEMALARGRVHEVTGSARRVLAAALAGRAQAEGPVLWLRPAWGAENLYPQGLAAFADPGALITVACPRAPDILWAAEEALASGAVALVIAELAAAPDLRQIRRLHRAATEGVARAAGNGAGNGAGKAAGKAAGAAGKHGAKAGSGRRAPLGVLMMHEDAGSRIAGIETRWALQSLPAPGDAPRERGPAWRLERLQARNAPPDAWPLRQKAGGLRVAG